jgi:hypothetical protein
MNSNKLEFSLFDHELLALATLIAGLNRNGVPYTLKRNDSSIEITVGTGF